MKKTIRSGKRNVIGARVRQIRRRQNPPVSQEDLAGRLAAMGILMDRSAVSRIENQTRYVMDYEAEAIAKSLKVPLESLFGHI